MTTEIYVHEPTPPYTRIEGPVPFRGLTRRLGLSIDSDADFTVSSSDVDEKWLRPGMCWTVEQTDEEVWAGFIQSQPIGFRTEEVPVTLAGPKKALLNIELAVRLPVPASRGFAVQQALLAAQSQNIGMHAGKIDHEGAAVALDVRGETISDFIETITEASSGSDWLERVYKVEDNQLIFALDFGSIQRPTDITIGDEAILDGLFTRQPIVASLTVLGEAGSFAERRAISTGVDSSRIASEAADGIIAPISGSTVDLLISRDIGPAAGRHAIEISERFNGDRMLQHVQERHLELLGQAEELSLVLNSTLPVVRQIRAGDVIRVRVPNWALDLSLDVKLHVEEITLDESNGRKEVVGSIQL